MSCTCIPFVCQAKECTGVQQKGKYRPFLTTLSELETSQGLLPCKSKAHVPGPKYQATSPKFFGEEVVDFYLSLDIARTFLSLCVDKGELRYPSHFWNIIPGAEVLILHLFPLSILNPYTSPTCTPLPAQGVQETSDRGENTMGSFIPPSWVWCCTERQEGRQMKATWNGWALPTPKFPYLRG